MIPLPVISPEAVQIGTTCFAVVFGDERVDYYANLEPLDFHMIGECTAMLMRIGRFRAINGIKTGHLMEVFSVSRSTVERSRRLFLEGGEAAFFKPRRGRRLSALTSERAERATRLLAEGLSGRAVADALGVSATSVYNWINKGLVGSRRNREDDSATAEPASDRNARDQRDRQAVMGRATCDTIGRVLASVGQAGPVAPEFTPARGVPCGGVLTALPALLREGLLSTTEILSPLPRGYYGLATIFLCIAFMVMARIRTPESLRYHAPGEWGAILGHDRAPEAKTLRSKIKPDRQGRGPGPGLAIGAGQPVAGRGPRQLGDPVRRWSRQGLCRPQGPSSQALRRAPEALCLPASTRYWVNALGGQPLLCLHKPLDPKMARALEHDVVPALERLGVFDRAQARHTGGDPGLRSRRLEPGPVQAARPARRCRAHLAQELQGGGLAGGRLPEGRGADPRARHHPLQHRPAGRENDHPRRGRYRQADPAPAGHRPQPGPLHHHRLRTPDG